MHLKASDAIGQLDKIKWANTKADERLQILHTIQKHILEEMEDLGVEEAEMKNMHLGTTDNLFGADACRLTAVVPLAFGVSSAIELYKTNLTGKSLEPVKVTKVSDVSVDMIDFGTGTATAEVAAAVSDGTLNNLDHVMDHSSNNDDMEEETTAKTNDNNDYDGGQEEESSQPKLDEKELEITTTTTCLEEEHDKEMGDFDEVVIPSSPPPVPPSMEPPPPPPPTPPALDLPFPPSEEDDDDTPAPSTDNLPELPTVDAPLPENNVTGEEPKEEEPQMEEQDDENAVQESSEAEATTEPSQENNHAEDNVNGDKDDKDDDAKGDELKDDNGEHAVEPDQVDNTEHGTEPPVEEALPPSEDPPPPTDDTVEKGSENVKEESQDEAEENEETGDDSKEDDDKEEKVIEEQSPDESPDKNGETEHPTPGPTPGVTPGPTPGPTNNTDENNNGEASHQPNSLDQEQATNNKLLDDNRNIKITFDPHDEFGKLADDDYVTYHDILVSPRTWNEKGYFAKRQERIRISGEPEQRVGPYDRRDPQATAILGASCYSAAAEIIKATFLDGHVVVYKPHPYYAECDRIWSEILKPLVEKGALSYCLPDQGPELVADPRIDQVYMTGSIETVEEIKKNTTKPCVFQTGGVNPVIIVPGRDRPWGVKELRHHALQIVSAGKFNGGHFCGRPQVIVTSKSWDQREDFLEELESAISERTPPEGSYDPKYRKVFDRFISEYPDGKVIEAQDLYTDAANVLLVTGASVDSYGLKHEAFSQVFIEVALDIPDHPVAFLPEAVKFCNAKLYGSLCATVVVDDATSKAYNGIVNQALSDLHYGTVSTNAIACFGWFNPSLYWGNYKKDGEFGKSDGVGGFGNLFGYENACKSIITDNFCAQGHFLKTSRDAYSAKMDALSFYATEPTWKRVTAYKLKGVKAAAVRKDW